MKMRSFRMAAVLAAGLVIGLGADAASAALSQQTGGSGYSGKLSRNRAIRMQQLNCDPAVPPEGTDPYAVNPEPTAPVQGSTSVTYDASVVTLADLFPGPAYMITGAQVAVAGEGGAFLQDLASFLEAPAGQELGYVQICYSRALPSFPTATALDPEFQPGLIPILPNYTLADTDGLAGFDTHGFLFAYREGVADETVASYTIFAAPEDFMGAGNDADFLYGIGPDGQGFTLGPKDLAPATVSASLVPSAIPLPPAAWMGLVTMGGMVVARLRGRFAAVGR